MTTLILYPLYTYSMSNKREYWNEPEMNDDAFFMALLEQEVNE